MNTLCDTSDLLVFSHLRWDQSLQRPHHIISRYAKHRRVFYIEKAQESEIERAYLDSQQSHESVTIISPYLPLGLSEASSNEVIKMLLYDLLHQEEVYQFVSLYYTPKAFNFSNHLQPSTVLFDYQDTTFSSSEQDLMDRAHIIFTCGSSLFETKRNGRVNLFQYPSSIDYDHFHQGRRSLGDPADQASIPYPRIGYYGDDSHFNEALVMKMAQLRPEFQFILLMDKPRNQSCPEFENIHYLGKKDYYSLPAYFSGWDCGFIPLSISEETLLISLSQIPELLASATPVVSTSLPDAAHPYSDLGLIHLADHPEHFVQSIEKAINDSTYDTEWLQSVDEYLAEVSWDSTFKMMSQIELKFKHMRQSTRIPAYEDKSLMAIGIV
jgi:UDP-galactopyranose mutase